MLPQHVSALRESSSGSRTDTVSQPDQQIALCYPQNVSALKGHFQEVEILHFHRQVNKLFTHFVDLPVKMYHSHSLNTEHVGVTQRQ